MSGYIGRIAPTPSGELHLGHASTFLVAASRSREARGHLLLRLEDLDSARCSTEFVQTAVQDLAWLGIPYHGEIMFQSQRRAFYIAAWRSLRDAGLIYPCSRSRSDVAASSLAPHEEDPIFPPEWRNDSHSALSYDGPSGTNWRFRVPDYLDITFQDGRLGAVTRRALRDFGDFLVWNRHDVPAYELAVVVDDIASGITEIVRGEDLLTSTSRQILLYRAFTAVPPRFFHTPLICDTAGKRLSKRCGPLSLRAFRESGLSPWDIPSLAALAES